MFVLIVIGEKGNLTEEIAKERAKITAQAINLLKPHELAELAIFGYDDDPRELWAIRESRDYFITFFEALVANNVITKRILPQTLTTIQACYAARSGKTVETYGTVEDTIRQSVEQVMQHRKNNLH